MKYVNLKKAGVFNSTTIANLGKAIAFNAKKNGTLAFIDLTSTINSRDLVDNLYKNM